MCKKKQFKYTPSRIDKCMEHIIRHLNNYYNAVDKRGLHTVACCCGHGKYHMTILVKDKFGNVWDLFTQNIIKRKKRFYKKDEKGYYYVPECSKQS